LLKRETRVLGLSGTFSHDQFIVVGVIFRGSLWLDGAFALTLNLTEHNWLDKLASAIRRTRQFSQLHAIFISRRLSTLGRIPIADLTKRVRLPIIEISKSATRSKASRKAPRSGRQSVVVEGRHVLVSARGVDSDEAARLYLIACHKGCRIPEAVRVADLVARQLARHS
jgi:endonuclease V-like protein UPF0215 family